MQFADNFTRKGTVVYVVDGDTLDIECDLGFYIKVKERFRMKGIDTPEIFGETKEAGMQAKNFVEGLLLNKEVTIISTKMDGFRRWLADVYFTDSQGTEHSLTEVLLSKKLGIPLEYVKEHSKDN